MKCPYCLALRHSLPVPAVCKLERIPFRVCGTRGDQAGTRGQELRWHSYQHPCNLCLEAQAWLTGRDKLPLTVPQCLLWHGPGGHGRPRHLSVSEHGERKAGVTGSPAPGSFPVMPGPMQELYTVALMGRWSLAIVSAKDHLTSISFKGFPGGSDGKEFACNVGGLSSIPGLGRSPGEGNDNPLQYSGLENSMDRGAWWTTQSMGSQKVGLN